MHLHIDSMPHGLARRGSKKAKQVTAAPQPTPQAVAPSSYRLVTDRKGVIQAVLIPYNLTPNHYDIAAQHLELNADEGIVESGQLATHWDLSSVRARADWIEAMEALANPPFPKTTLVTLG
jgi:hypothetical protein